MVTVCWRLRMSSMRSKQNCFVATYELDTFLTWCGCPIRRTSKWRRDQWDKPHLLRSARTHLKQIINRLSCCQGAVFYVIRFVWFDAYTTHCHRERSSYLSMTSGFACLCRPMPHFLKNDLQCHSKALSGDRVVCAHVRLPGVCKS